MPMSVALVRLIGACVGHQALMNVVGGQVAETEFPPVFTFFMHDPASLFSSFLTFSNPYIS